MRKVLALALISTALVGCGLLRPSLDTEALTPQSSGPVVAAPELPFISPTQVGSWVLVNPAETPSPQAVWLNNLGFAGLRPLLELAKQNNPNLQIAQARLRQAEAQNSSALAAIFPQITLSASGQRSRNAPRQQGPNSRANVENRFNASASGSQNLDLFGRVWNGLALTSGLREASRQQLANTQLQLQAAVAQTYLGLLAATEAERAWAVAIGAAEEQNRLTQLRYAAGDIPITEAQPIFATLQNLRVQALETSRQRVELENALNVLVGRAPQAIELSEADLAQLAKPRLAVPAKISATALLARPDVAAAAQQLAAANANIGVARASFLPNISLQGNTGFTDNELGSLFDWSQRSWSVGPVLTLPIFQGGALRANLKRSWGLYDEAVASYRGVVLSAYAEASNAFTTAQTAQASAQNATDAAYALAKVANAYQRRYSLGDVAKADWLGSQILAAQSRASAAQANAANHAAAVELYTALGGQMETE
jgi:multidrug efflux system outer membrane protein